MVGKLLEDMGASNFSKLNTFVEFVESEITLISHTRDQKASTLLKRCIFFTVTSNSKIIILHSELEVGTCAERLTLI